MERFQWDDGNRDKNWLKHGVSIAESEQVFFNDPVLGELESQIWDEPRFYAFGQTDEGRRLAIIYTIRQNMIRVISARDMSRKERRAYDDA